MDGKKYGKGILIKSGFWYTVSNFLPRAVVFITTPLFTRLMSKEDYGNFSIFAIWQAMLVNICGIEIYATLNRARFDFPEKKELDSYITSSVVLCTIFTVAAFIIYTVFTDVLGWFSLFDRKYMLLMFAHVLAYPVLSMFMAKQRINYKYKINAALSIFISVFSSVLAYVLAFAMREERLLGRILGQYGPTIVAGLCIYVYFICCSRTVTRKAWRYALRFGIPMVFSYIGSQLLLSSDSLVVKYICSAEQVSHLSVAHSAANVVLILVHTLNTAWAPWFYDMLRTGERTEIRKTYLIFLWGTVVWTFLVLLIGPEIIMALGGAGYAESVDIFPPVITCGIFSVLTAQFGNLETYYKKPEYSAVLTSIVAALNVFLDILGAKLMGYRGVCYVTVFCQLLLIGMHYQITNSMGIRELLPLKHVILTLFSSIAMIPIALILYQNITARYGCIIFSGIAAVIFVLINWKEIIGKIKMILRS